MAVTGEPSFTVPGDKDGDDEVAECHKPGTSNKDRLTAQLVDVHDSGDSEEEHDNTDDTGGEQRDGVASEAESLEDLRSVVKDSVDTSPLLEEHGEASDSVSLCKCRNDSNSLNLRNTDTLEHGLALEQGSNSLELELGYGHGRAICKVRVLLGDGALLEKRLSSDLAVLKLDELVVLRKTSEFGKGSKSLFLTVVVYQPTWREWHEDHSDEQNYGRSELQAERKKPCTVLLARAGTSNVVGTIYEDISIWKCTIQADANSQSIQKEIRIPKVMASC